MVRRFFALISIFLFASYTYAQSLDDFTSAALANDAELQRLELARQRLDLQYALEDLGPPISLQIGTGNSGVSFRTNGGAEGPATAAATAPAWEYSVSPFAEITLDGEHTVRGSGSLSGTVDEPIELRSATFGYGWSPGTLGETLADRVTAATRADARADAEQRIRARTATVRRVVVSLARDLLAAEAAVTEASVAVGSAEDAMSQSQALGNTNPGSAAAEQLQVSLARARRVLARRELERQEATRDLAELTGIAADQAPRLSVTGPPSVSIQPEATSEFASAIRDYDLSLLRYGSEANDPTTVSVDTEYVFVPRQQASTGPDTPALHTIGGGATVGFGDWTVTLSSRLRVSSDPDLVPAATTTSVGLTWALPNRSRDTLDAQLDEVDLAQAQHVLANTERAMRDEIQALEAQGRSLSERLIQLEEDRLLAQLRLGEAQRRSELGLAGASLIEERQSALAALEFDEYLLAYDLELYRLSIESISGEEE